MQNIIDYIKNTPQSFAEKPFNAIDSLVLSQCANFHFDGIVPSLCDTESFFPVGRLINTNRIEDIVKDTFYDENNYRLLFALSQSLRYRDIAMKYYVEKLDMKSEKQFSAVTFVLPDGETYVAFAGTDATFVGWKEDFNMLYLNQIPSQTEALKYLTAVSELSTGSILCGGHSKGGNLAIFAGANASSDIKSRVFTIFSHDAPGFNRIFLKSPSYQSVKYRIHRTIPQSSFVGMLLENDHNYFTVKSNKFWILQHNPYSWEIDESGSDFCYAEKLSRSAKFTNKTLNEWLRNMTRDEREKFVDTLYTVLSATGADNFHDLAFRWKTEAPIIVKTIKNLDGKTKKFLGKLIEELGRFALKNMKN